MKKTELTEAQQRYREFDRRRVRIISVLLILLVMLLTVLAVTLRAQAYKAALICARALAVYGAAAVLICVILRRWDKELRPAEAEEPRSGLFAEIWEEFQRNRLEGFTDGKVIFAENHNNTIELGIRRKGHDYHIVIDSEGLYMVRDEESAVPAEQELPLARFADIDQFCTAIRTFIDQ